MNSFALCPLQRGHNPKFANGLLEQDLMGGFARQRVQFINNTHTVGASVLLDTPIKRQYFWAFWRDHTLRLPRPFLWRLIIDDNEMADYECQFVAGSIQEQERSGKIVSVAFEVRCKPNRFNQRFDSAIVKIWESKDPVRLLNLLEQLVNKEMPEALGDV
ncbi:MAG: hypothetical protein Q4P13_11130 [Psychrobacter sp.]|nr:hypothetical protein [Psychrobacter sp.]